MSGGDVARGTSLNARAAVATAAPGHEEGTGKAKDCETAGASCGGNQSGELTRTWSHGADTRLCQSAPSVDHNAAPAPSTEGMAAKSTSDGQTWALSPSRGTQKQKTSPCSTARSARDVATTRPTKRDRPVLRRTENIKGSVSQPAADINGGNRRRDAGSHRRTIMARYRRNLPINRIFDFMLEKKMFLLEYTWFGGEGRRQAACFALAFEMPCAKVDIEKERV